MADTDPMADHVFIQAAMARGYFMQAEAQDLFHKLLGSNPGELARPSLGT